jgi:hypothetical protein
MSDEQAPENWRFIVDDAGSGPARMVNHAVLQQILTASANAADRTGQAAVQPYTCRWHGQGRVEQIMFVPCWPAGEPAWRAVGSAYFVYAEARAALKVKKEAACGG